MYSYLSRVWEQLKVPIHTGAKRDDSLRVCTVMGAGVGLVSAILTIMNIIQGRGFVTVTTAVLCLGGIAIALSAVFLRDTRVASGIMFVACAFSFTYYALTGVNEGFAVLWTLVVPVAFCYFVSVRVGLALSYYFFVFLVVLFYTPLRGCVEGIYSSTFMTRFPILYALNLLLTTIAMVQYHVATLKDLRAEEHLEHEVAKQTRLARERAEKLENMSMELELVLANTIDAKDHYTNGHSVRVAEYAMLLAEELGMDKDEVAAVRTEGLLHDIGKIGVTDPVLNKPGRLTDDEYHDIQRHTVVGHDILIGMESLRAAADVALWHHERWDGKGYPDGLAGEDIPLHARIVAVADAFDAMRSKRVYSGVMDMDEIRRELEAGRGTQFDPTCLDAFLRLDLSGE